MQQHVYAISQTCSEAGIKHAVICPGSRSAPLVFAFTQSNITCHSVVDERSAAYMALGMAQQLNEPVVLICTSGTAVLNFFPAVAEAYYQKVPLLILTADRPPELLNQQDGQMIMQRDIYGKHVRLSIEIPCYNHGGENSSETAGMIRKAIMAALSGGNGPVHVNIPLREPLYPAQLYKQITRLSGFVRQQAPSISEDEAAWVTKQWREAKRKLVLVGQMPCNGALNGALHELQAREDVVIVCDVLSNVYEFNTAKRFDYLLLRADEKTLLELNPDCILSLGGPVLSKSLKLWLQKLKPATHIRFNINDAPVDTYRNVTRHITGNPSGLLFQLGLESGSNPDKKWKFFWQAADAVVHEAAEKFLETKSKWSELHAMKAVLKRIPDVANVQVGNSSIIRYISYLGGLNSSWVVNGNRGTSGIDGCTSTAVGAALVNNRPTYLITGDIAFLYDINALWNKVPQNLKIIVLNNQGGGIFQLIEGPGKHKQQLDYFTTPHHQSMKQIALQKGLEYYFCASSDDWKQVNRFFGLTSGPSLLELQFDRSQNALEFELFKKIKL